MLIKEVIAFYTESYETHIYKIELLVVKAGGGCMYHWVLKG
jgi:hypothetical protein